MPLKRILAISALLLSSSPALALNGSISADYARTFEPGDPFMNIGLGLSQTLTPGTNLSFSQGFEKNLIIDDSRREFEAADSRIGLSFSTTSKSPVNWTLGLGASLPVSRKSQRDGTISKPEISLGTRVSSFVNLALSGFFRYQINRYQSTPTDSGGGGDALPQYSYGANFGLSRQVLGCLTFGADASYREIQFESVAVEGRVDTPIDNSPVAAYSVGFSIALSLGKFTEFAVGLQQGRLLEQQSWSEFVIFDESESTWSLSLAQSF